MPNIVPASAPALPKIIPFPRPPAERFKPILIKPESAIIDEAEHRALRVAVRVLAMDHDALVAMVVGYDQDPEPVVRWMELGCDLAASRLSILIDLLAEARHRLATVREVCRG